MSLLTAARASFQATLASAGAPVATYVSPLRRLLTLGRWAGLALLLVWALSCFVALRSVDEATRVIGHDTAPSITAAERIRSLLSDANRNLALMTLLYEPDSGPFSSAFRADIADAEALLVEAAQNITYGDAEKTPITTIMQGLAEYERQVGRARMAGSGPAAIKAEGLMRNSILPATEALDKANYDHLDAQYESFLSSKFGLNLLTWASSLAALACLAWLQWRIANYARRRVNPGLALATLVVAIFSGYAALASLSASADLKTAKVDAFDSIYALTTLLAVANDAGAADGFWLVANDVPAARTRYNDLFQTMTNAIVGVDTKTALANTAENIEFPGLLGKELANITFVGEREAAVAALKAWGDYRTAAVKPRQLTDAGRLEEAAEIAGGGKPGQVNWAFGVFQREVELTIKINQDAFDAAIASSEASVNGFAYGALLVAWLVASAAVWLGVGQRLRDYEF